MENVVINEEFRVLNPAVLAKEFEDGKNEWRSSFLARDGGRLQMIMTRVVVRLRLISP